MNSVLEMFDISGRSALVTGAASGIGLAYTEALAEAGAGVTLTDINLDAAEREAERLRGLGWDVRAASLDVCDLDQVGAVFDAHEEAYGGLDIAFANAGVGIGAGWKSPAGGRTEDGQIDTIDPEIWRKTMEVNLDGIFHTVRHAARLMKKGGKGGSIVATSSNASLITVPIICTAYMLAKGGVTQLVRNVALELAEFNIRVNAIAPGSFVTNIGGGHMMVDEIRDEWAKLVPLVNKMGEPKQIKPLALYLASDASSFVTGAEMFIDGGVSLTSGF